MKILGIIVVLLFSLGVRAQQADTLKAHVVKTWEEFQVPDQAAAKAVLDQRERLAKYIRSRDKAASAAVQENGAQALRRVAALYEGGKDARLKSSVIKKVLQGVDLSTPEFVNCTDFARVVEDYYALKAIAAGAPADRAWGSMWFNTTVETIGNEYDYARYKQILELNNPALTLAYLPCLRQVFRYNGYTEGLDDLRPLVEKYMPDGELKATLMDLYKTYEHLQEGKPAPSFKLKDYKGGQHALEDYRGKVLVIDVWATWCGGCIAKLPRYLEMRDKYKDRDDIEFITISIDDEGMFTRWKYTLPRLKLMGLTNLIASKTTSDFHKDYNITGIPRYFLIDKQGNIVTVYAPTPGEAFEALINRTLGK